MTGCSYFGVRIPRHVEEDMRDLARRGYTGVLHTFSENDLAYYRATMQRIVELSHGAGLEVQMCPWGVGRTFGGEAESRWVGFHPEACQVLDDGCHVPTGCLNRPAYRAFCREWADAVVDAGADRVFWDEPHWTVPEHVGIDDPARWACRCDEPAGPFVGRFARLLRETADRAGVGAELWLPSFGLTREDIPDLEAVIAAARAEGIERLWTWGYEACGHMSKLATPDAPLVWEAVSAGLAGVGSPT